MGRPSRTAADRALMAHIGERLRWVREALDLSQTEIGAVVGVTQTAWGKYEQGIRTPDQFKIPEVLSRLRISREYLLGSTLDGVERNLAIRIAAAHPELALTTDTELHKGTN